MRKVSKNWISEFFLEYNFKLLGKDSLHSIISEATNNENFKLGDQVKMKTGGRVGVDAFVGPTDFQAGIWIGVILERPEGKNNGTVDGRVYFKVFSNFSHKNVIYLKLIL